MMEMQAVVTELIETFEFDIPEGGLDNLCFSVGMMLPMVRGKLQEGVQMPLAVRPASSW